MPDVWIELLLAVRDAPAQTTSALEKAGRLADAGNALRSLRAMERRGLVRRLSSGKPARWVVTPSGALILDSVSGLPTKAVEIGRGMRVATAGRDQLPALGQALLREDVRRGVAWLAVLADGNAGVVMGLYGRDAIEVQPLKGRFAHAGLRVDDVGVDRVVTESEELVALAREILGLDHPPELLS
jgi:hypothetical protein